MIHPLTNVVDGQPLSPGARAHLDIAPSCDAGPEPLNRGAGCEPQWSDRHTPAR